MRKTCEDIEQIWRGNRASNLKWWRLSLLEQLITKGSLTTEKKNESIDKRFY